MEEEQNIVDGETSETEDMPLSASEEVDVPLDTYSDHVIKIDYNSRVMTRKASYEDIENEDYDTNFVDNFSRLKCRRKSENELYTSTEDLDVSDEEKPCCSYEPLDYGSLIGACSKKDVDSISTLNYSTSRYKNEYNTDAECISNDEGMCNLKKKSEEGINRTLSSGLTVIDFATNSPVKLPKTQAFLSSLNVKNVFSNSLMIDEKNLIDLQDDSEKPLMTCLEFLKSEISDDNNTDAEDLSVGSLGDNESFGLRNRNASGKKFKLPGDVSGFSFESAQENRIVFPDDRRRSSTAELLTEEETLCFDNPLTRGKKRWKKHAVKFDEESDDSFTDEELLDMNDKEWTETDESGGVRQITQIKTETSIKLEGEGHDLDLGSDDIISRTTTTTTRIITTVTTDGEEETQNEQQVVEDGDDFRHSVEVILNQFMSSDSDATKPEDSTTEHDE